MASWNIWIDTGGTFTDCIARGPSGQQKYIKVLSNSSLRGTIEQILSPKKLRISQHWNAPDNFVCGLAFQLLHSKSSPNTVTSFDAEQSILTFADPILEKDLQAGMSFEILSDEEAPLLAARLATQTLPDQALPPIQLRLATTKGTNALLEHKGAPTLLLITKGLGDLLYIGDQRRPDLFAFHIQKPAPLFDEVVEIPERLDADGNILQELKTSLPSHIQSFLEQENASIAISLMHSYKNNVHEKELEQQLIDLGANYISCSSDMSPFIKILPRAQTTIVNAYLNPILQLYFHSVESTLSGGSLFIMNSAAGLVSSTRFKPKDSLLSGPAGGVLGATSIGEKSGVQRIISLDMGGTSTDVARYDNGFDYQFEHTVGEAHIKAPALAIETVAAGGGSICSFDGQKLTVGPDSAGAHPGPACYNAGGPFTLTDVNLLLGRLQPNNFSIPVSKEAAELALQSLIKNIEKSGHVAKRNEILNGLLKIANERMADAINKVSLRKGYNPANYTLVAFGGAGAQHATAIASLLGMSSVLIPEKAGLLSAYGLGNASVEQFAEQQVLTSFQASKEELPSLFSKLEEQARENLIQELPDVSEASIMIRRRMVFMRLSGQESSLEIAYDGTESLKEHFRQAYRHRYGHWIEGREIEIESVRVVAAATHPDTKNSQIQPNTEKPVASYQWEVQFDQSKYSTPVYERSELHYGNTLPGPSIILDPYSTTVIEPGWNAAVDQHGTLKLTQSTSLQQRSAQYSETVSLELFTNRFTSIAEEMGEMMQRTALSVNVKERLDFSCALLNADGQLIVNAPHIPVHLGALGLCVRQLKNSIAMHPGDVVVTNHPRFGGSHLPDITVVTPVYDNNETLLGYTACRAHHAEIGGTRPGSMPPNATSLIEEGVVIPPTYLIKKGVPQWDKIKSILTEAAHPSRAVEENLADLQAAVAANQQGVNALKEMVDHEGTSTVKRYMDTLKKRAAEKASSMIADLPDLSEHHCEMLDDGRQLCARIKKEGEKLHIDFSGSSDVHPGNLNATPAIVQSVIMYVLRCLIRDPIPLNEGLLEPVEVTLPKGILNPDFKADPQDCPAVVGGNTETSQRLVDLLLKPFGQMACSQGTMNNVLFGDDTFGYYETIGGGTGAGPGFDGCDGVHHHMTNTAGTDPEILEHRYPVRLERYEIRRGSGGSGKHSGGNGISRELTFLKPVSLSVLSQHRVKGPYGLYDGKAGETGSQYIIRKNGHRQQLESIDGADLGPGDQFIIHTPGGGGYGRSK